MSNSWVQVYLFNTLKSPPFLTCTVYGEKTASSLSLVHDTSLFFPCFYDFLCSKYKMCLNVSLSPTWSHGTSCICTLSFLHQIWEAFILHFFQIIFIAPSLSIILLELSLLMY
jgi:hypothetical protein